MKNSEKPEKIESINQSFSAFRRISLALVFATGMAFLAQSSKAANVLADPGFETTVFSASTWTQNSSENWSSSAASAVNGTGINIKLVHTGNDGLWMQGVYGNANEGIPLTLDSSASQTIACFPGNAYTADAWYSSYLYCTNHIGGDDGQLQSFYGTAHPNSPQDGGGCGLFEGTGAGAQSDGWVEVRFLSSGNAVLADYKSMIIDPTYLGAATDAGLEGTPGYFSYSGTLPIATNALGNIYLAWQDYQVTNQYDVTLTAPNTDPDTEIANNAVTNTLGAGQSMIAPAGASKVEFSIHLYQSTGNQAAAPFWDDATLNQVAGPSPSVITPTPGTSFFTGATNFTFNVASASTGGAPLPTNSTSSIGIVVNGQNQTGNLQFSGPSTGLTATLPVLASNTIYTITMSVTNSVGLVSTKTVNFDTFPTNTFVVSAEDYDYTNGLFIDNPIPTDAPAANSYFGTGGVQGVDLETYNGGVPPSGELIRTDGRAVMQIAADTQLPLYLAQSNADVVNVQIAYNNGGNWFNYTRHYPAGNYVAFLRYNNGTVGNVESLNILTSGYGTSTQTTNRLGEFIAGNTGSGYAWAPLTDAFGNTIVLNVAGQNTLQLLSGDGNGAGGIANFVDFILVPAAATFPPIINNVSPTSAGAPNFNVFEKNVANITASVGSQFSTVASSNIHVVLNGVDVTSRANITGNNTNWNVSIPCPQNQIVSFVISATDANGMSNSVSESFDTFSENNFMIEAVDFDFNGGQFIDNPVPTGDLGGVGNEQTNSYFDGGIYMTNVAVANIDYDNTYDGEGGAQGVYRPLDQGVACQSNPGDYIRMKFTNSVTYGGVANDHNLGYVNAGQWENYTRTIPPGHYNIWARAGSGGGAYANEQIALVTSGQGTTTQTTLPLGTFHSTTTSTWNNYYWNALRDTNGNVVTVPLGGVQTLRFTRGDNLNVHFFMLVPVVSASLTVSISGSGISLNFPTQSGYTYTVLWNSTLTGGSWQTLSSAGNPVSGDGTVKTVTDTVGSSQRFYKLQVQ